MSYTIRKAERKDYEQVNTLLCELVQQHAVSKPRIFHRTKTFLTKEQFNKLTYLRPEPIFVTEIDGKVIAVICCKYSTVGRTNIFNPNKKLHISYLYVASNYRRKGVGTALLKHIEGLAKQYNCEISLNVDSENHSAIQFYKSLGYYEECITLCKKV